MKRRKKRSLFCGPPVSVTSHGRTSRSCFSSFAGNLETSAPVSRGVRQQEYETFRVWIQIAVRDPGLAAAATDYKLQSVGGERPGLRDMSREESEGAAVISCKHLVGKGSLRELSFAGTESQKIGRNGVTCEDVDAISWVVLRDPAATLDKLIETGNINLEIAIPVRC